MSEDNQKYTGTKKRRKKRGSERVREKNKLAMRRLRAENPEYCEIERIKNRINAIRTRTLNKTDESTHMSVKEKNKIAMRNRRANEEYRKRENTRNRIAMRMKRKDESIRLRDNERNRKYMQMKRKQQKGSVSLDQGYMVCASDHSPYNISDESDHSSDDPDDMNYSDTDSSILG